MESNAMRPLLKSLCSNSVWNYVVFWKLRHQNPGILSWEYGCFSYPKVGLEEIVSDDTCCKDAISPDFEANLPNGNLDDYSVRLSVADMSSLQYTMGEGVVGEVASTGDHSWVSFNDIFSGEFKCPEEWLLQYASGIKTILLVPVLPYGVVQLGSLEEVLEDTDIVAFVKSKFSSTSNLWDKITPFSLKNESKAQLLSNPAKNSDASLPTAFASIKSEHLERISTFELESQDLLPLTTLYDSTQPDAYNYGGMMGTGLVEIETPGMLELVERKLLDLSSLMEELQEYSDCYNFEEEFYREPFNRNTDSHPVDPFAGETSTGKANLWNNSYLDLHNGSELHEALGPVMESTLLPEDASNCWFSKGADAGYLLEHVVASGKTDTENSCSTQKNVMSCNSFPEKFTAAPIFEKKSNTSSLSSGDSPLWSNAEKREGGGESDDIKLLQGSKALNGCKRRGKPGENQKPRPRDRQLIQDCVKELRELVPNSAKCSIDGLLDKTVNHMLYLRSIAHQAEKLRQCTLQEHVGSKTRSTKINEHCANGTSWAFEVGNESKLCPIFVEDLDYPDCMLIQVLCNEDGLFLEIAEAIRGLELTILKGVLESRSDNTWALFIVEASKGFHRLDIFWPLMQLLQRKRKPISSSI